VLHCVAPKFFTGHWCLSKIHDPIEGIGVSGLPFHPENLTLFPCPETVNTQLP